MALTHNPNSESATAPRQVLVANPHLHGTAYDRKVALLVEVGRSGSRGIVVNDAFRQTLLAGAAEDSSRREQVQAEPIQLGMIEWGPGSLEQELRAGVWMPTATTFEAVLASQDSLWANLVRGIGRSVLRDACGFQEFPRDIRAN